MKRSNVANCMFSKWLSRFQSYTVPTKVLQLPVDFIQYLNEDGVVLPGSKVDSASLDSVPREDGWDECTELSAPSFDNLCKQVEESICDLGGVVFPKLTWSAPQDACWISSDGTLRCQNFSDICLLLKSSDFVAHDLMHAYDECEDSCSSHREDEFELVLRKWVDIAPSMEFRCFVKDNTLLGISQRHPCTFFPFLLQEKQVIVDSVRSFFYSIVKGNFLDSTFVFDVYQESDGSIRLIDFNPFGRVTDPLLFSWDELEASNVNLVNPDIIDFRIVTCSNGIQPSPYSYYRLPRDAIAPSSDEDICKMIAFFQANKMTNGCDEEH